MSDAALTSQVDDADAQRTELMSRVATGDVHAWHQLVDQHIGWLWSVARSYRLSEADSADAIQTTWLRLLEHIDRINEPARVGAWLSTTLRRECLRILAHGKRVSPTEEAVLDRPDTAPAADLVLLMEEDKVALHAAIAELPPRWRELMMMLLDDPAPSYEEISRRLGMPIGSIGPTRGRCLERLRAYMTAEVVLA